MWEIPATWVSTVMILFNEFFSCSIFRLLYTELVSVTQTCRGVSYHQHSPCYASPMEAQIQEISLCFCCGESEWQHNQDLRRLYGWRTNSRIHHYSTQCIAFNQAGCTAPLPTRVHRSKSKQHEDATPSKPRPFSRGFYWESGYVFVKRWEGGRTWLSQFLLFF